MQERVRARPCRPTVNFECRDTEALKDLIERRCGPTKVEYLGADNQISLSGSWGTVAGIDFGRAETTGDFKLIPERTYDGILFFLPTKGRMIIHRDKDDLIGTPGVAIAAEGDGCHSADLLENCAFSGIAIDRSFLTQRISLLLGRAVVKELVFREKEEMNSSGATALESLVTCISNPGFGIHFNRASLIAERIRETLIDLVLETWPNSYSEMLHRPPQMISPRYVKLAIEFINEHAEIPSSGRELAALSGVSLRSLQNGFRRFVGISIAAYQRQVRLDRARADILHDSTVPIESVALRWGFTNAGRFSRYFKSAYGVFPAELMRRG